MYEAGDGGCGAQGPWENHRAGAAEVVHATEHWSYQLWRQVALCPPLRLTR